jgi:hypothetical protein
MSDPASEQDQVARLVDRVTIKVLYGPFTLIGGVLGGMLASRLVARIWRALAGEDEVPGATDQATSWAEILPAAILHGIVFGVVKALVDRASAVEFERLTGLWPGKRSRAKAVPLETPN